MQEPDKDVEKVYTGSVKVYGTVTKESSLARTQKHVQSWGDVVVVSSLVRFNHLLRIVGDKHAEEGQSTIQVDVVECLQASANINTLHDPCAFWRESAYAQDGRRGHSKEGKKHRAQARHEHDH